MTTTTSPTYTGTVKVGRWTYRAQLDVDPDGSPIVRRNTKRDGTGEWEILTGPAADTFEPDAESETNAILADPDAMEAQAEVVYHDDSGQSTQDYWDLRKAYQAIFASFALTVPDEVAEAAGCDNARAYALTDYLDGVGLTVQDFVNGKERVIQSAETYDHITRDQAMVNFEEAVPVNAVVGKVAKAHGSRPGAQTHKPGKSQWRIGDLCPQGVHILDEHTIYAMPSGRKQCRGCRKGYPSNAPQTA